MKATIEFDFATMFLYRSDIYDNGLVDVVEVIEKQLYDFKKDDVVEVLKVFESEEFSGGIGYVIFNPKTHRSISVAGHVISFIEE